MPRRGVTAVCCVCNGGGPCGFHTRLIYSLASSHRVRSAPHVMFYILRLFLLIVFVFWRTYILLVEYNGPAFPRSAVCDGRGPFYLSPLLPCIYYFFRTLGLALPRLVDGFSDFGLLMLSRLDERKNICTVSNLPGFKPKCSSFLNAGVKNNIANTEYCSSVNSSTTGGGVMYMMYRVLMYFEKLGCSYHAAKVDNHYGEWGCPQ